MGCNLHTILMIHTIGTRWQRDFDFIQAFRHMCQGSIRISGFSESRRNYPIMVVLSLNRMGSCRLTLNWFNRLRLGHTSMPCIGSSYDQVARCAVLNLNVIQFEIVRLLGEHDPNLKRSMCEFLFKESRNNRLATAT